MKLRRAFIATLLSGVWTACRRAPLRTNEVVAVPIPSLPSEPLDDDWNRAPEYVAKLIPQDLVEPRLMKVSTPEVRVQAMSTASEIAFRLRWTDGDSDDLPGPGQFMDSCAVQLPKTLAPEPPDPQMGEAGRPVEILFWRADWQASVNGRGDSIQDLYPNAAVDHYPFQAQSLEPGSPAQKEMTERYAPAAALGNRRVGPRDSPVEEIVAEGPGTLSRSAASLGAKGRGVRTKDGWAVVLSRRQPEGLVPRQRTQVAFAVWEGSRKEVGSRKMRSAWIPLLMREAT